MEISSQYFIFYRSYIEKICQSIRNGKVLIVVGINSAGKTLLSLQLQSQQFKQKYFKNSHTHLVFLEFKDKTPPSSSQLYKYWLTQTAQLLHYDLPSHEVFNDFSFYFHLTEMGKRLKQNEKLVYVILDAQNILNQGEAFYKSLVYLHRFTYRKISYILLSEPQILESRNIWVQRFIEDTINYKFLFLKLFDQPTIRADIQREEEFLKAKLSEKHKSLIVKYSGGLHGVIGALAYFLKHNSQIQDIRNLKKIVFSDKMFEFWINDILHSLPTQSLRILKDVVVNKAAFRKYYTTIHGKWLIDLGLLKKNGKFPHPLMIPYVIKHQDDFSLHDNLLKYINSQFYFNKEKLKLSKKEKAILTLLFQAKGKVVTYDKIGEVIWKENPDKFSLWAIAQLIRRLKKKLSFYGVNPNIINSHRGEGYSLN